MSDKLINNAVKLLLDTAIEKYNSYGNKIEVSNCGPLTVKRISLAIETAFKLQNKYNVEGVIDSEYTNLSLFIQYQCKRELIRGQIQSFSETFDVNAEQLSSLKNFVGQPVKLQAYIADQQNGPTVVISNTVNLARCCKIHREAGWYIANCVEEIAKQFMPTFHYPQGLNIEQMVHFTNEKLSEYDQEKKATSGKNMHETLMEYLGW